MTVTVIQLFPPTVLTTSPATLFTMPSTPTNIVLNRGLMRFTNTDSSAHTVTAHAIESAGTAAVANTFLPGVSVPANSTLDVAVPVLKASGFIQAFAAVGTVVSVQALDGLLFS